MMQHGSPAPAPLDTPSPPPMEALKLLHDAAFLARILGVAKALSSQHHVEQHPNSRQQQQQQQRRPRRGHQQQLPPQKRRGCRVHRSAEEMYGKVIAKG